MQEFCTPQMQKIFSCSSLVLHHEEVLSFIIMSVTNLKGWDGNEYRCDWKSSEICKNELKPENLALH